MKDFEKGNLAHGDDGDEGDDGARRENQALSGLIRTHATRHRVSDALRARVQTEISLATLRQPDRDDTRAPQAQRGARWRAALRWPAWARGRWAAGMTGFALGALCFSIALPLLQATWRTTTIEDDVVARHVRALQSGRWRKSRRPTATRSSPGSRGGSTMRRRYSIWRRTAIR